MLIDPKTKAVSLEPFTLPHGTYMVVGTFRKGRYPKEEWFYSIKNEETGVFKDKPYSWIEAVNDKLNREE